MQSVVVCAHSILTTSLSLSAQAVEADQVLSGGESGRSSLQISDYLVIDCCDKQLPHRVKR